MYDENSFKNYLFWLQVKRVFLMIVFSIVGAFLGIVLSQFLIDVLLVLGSGFKVIIIAVSTLLFFGISLLLTAGTGKEVQDGYWKMAVLRKLTVISKKLDYLENLDEATPNQKEIVKKFVKDVKEEINSEPNIEQEDIIENKEPVSSNENIKEDIIEENEAENTPEEIKKDFAGNIVSSSKPSKKKNATKKQINKMKKK